MGGRNQGKGRVFYTASGHDERTWRLPKFQKLVSAGVLWASGRANDDAPPLPSLTVDLPPSIKEGGEADDRRADDAAGLDEAHAPAGRLPRGAGRGGAGRRQAGVNGL